MRKEQGVQAPPCRSTLHESAGSPSAKCGRSSRRRQGSRRRARWVVEWPHRYLATEFEQGRIDARTVLCVLGHDPKFAVLLLRPGPATPVQPDRARPGRAHPEETGIGIAAEIIAVARGGEGERLSRLTGPIHHPRSQVA